MASFSSNQEFFKAVDELIARLEAAGLAQAAHELREGHGCLNGLTDGWALFLDSIEKVGTTHASRLPRGEREALKVIRQAARKAVYGRRQ